VVIHIPGQCRDVSLACFVSIRTPFIQLTLTWDALDFLVFSWFFLFFFLSFLSLSDSFLMIPRFFISAVHLVLFLGDSALGWNLFFLALSEHLGSVNRRIVFRVIVAVLCSYYNRLWSNMDRSRYFW